MKIKTWIKSKLLNKKEKKIREDIYKAIEGAELSEHELKLWLAEPTTLKILKVFKFYKKQWQEGIISEELSNADLYKAIGICKAYDDIIVLLEETASSPQDLEAIIQTYIENRNEQ